MPVAPLNANISVKGALLTGAEFSKQMQHSGATFVECFTISSFIENIDLHINVERD
jgi:hypothetical protein